MELLVLAFCIGIIAGLRAMTAPAATAWAAKMGILDLSGSHLAFMGYMWTAWIFSLAAVGELINDKLPGTPSRKVPPQFIGRVVTGGLSGACFGAAEGRVIVGTIAGMLGAVAGTLGGASVRGALARKFGKDLPAALLEDAVAVLGAVAVVALSR